VQQKINKLDYQIGNIETALTLLNKKINSLPKEVLDTLPQPGAPPAPPPQPVPSPPPDLSPRNLDDVDDANPNERRDVQEDDAQVAQQAQEVPAFGLEAAGIPEAERDKYQRYIQAWKFGVPEVGIRQKMAMEGANVALLDVLPSPLSR
jgi:hypothetical protein